MAPAPKSDREVDGKDADPDPTQDPPDFEVVPWTRAQGEVILRPIPSPGDGPGIIYVFSLPESKDGRIRALFKVGLTKRTAAARIAEQSQDDYASHGTPVTHSEHRVSFCGLAEAAIHAELAYWRRKVRFKGCATVHNEWFEISSNVVQAVVSAKCLLVNAWYPPDASAED